MVVPLGVEGVQACVEVVMVVEVRLWIELLVMLLLVVKLFLLLLDVVVVGAVGLLLRSSLGGGLRSNRLQVCCVGGAGLGI